MATAFISIGASAKVNSDNTDINVPYPETISADNLLVIHVQAGTNGTTWSTPSGWTAVGSQQYGARVFTKIATGSESGSVTVTCNSASRLIGRMWNVGPVDTAAPVNVNNGVGGSQTITTITPTVANTLWLFLVGNGGAESVSYSSYAMATSDPTPWTEVYDEQTTSSDPDAGIGGAYSAIRPETTGTGNCTFSTVSSSTASGFVLAIAMPPNVTVSPAVIELASSVQEPTVSGSSSVSPAVIELASSVQAPTVTTAASKWHNQSKNTGTITNLPKTP